MKTDEYLYGKDIEVPEIPREVVMRRIELLQDNLEELMSHSYHIRDDVRTKAIFDAIKFWEEIT